MYELCTLNFMWMNDKSIAVSALTDKSFLDFYLNHITRKDYACFKELLRTIFIKGMLLY